MARGPLDAGCGKAVDLITGKGQKYKMTRMNGEEIDLCPDCQKSLKKWMIQEKFPASERDRVPVFADESGVLAVWGLGADERAAALPEAAESVLVILERT